MAVSRLASTFLDRDLFRCGWILLSTQADKYKKVEYGYGYVSNTMTDFDSIVGGELNAETFYNGVDEMRP